MSGTALVVASVLLALVASAYLLLAVEPSERSAETIVRPGPSGEPAIETTTTKSGETTDAVNESAVGVAAFTLALTLMPLGLNRSRWGATARAASAVVLLLFSLLGALSYGLYYLPAALAMTGAAIRAD